MNDGVDKCPHGFPTTTRPAPEGHGWVQELKPAACKLCVNEVLKTFHPGPKETAEPETTPPGVADAEELMAATRGTPGILEHLMRRVTELERAETNAAGKAETAEVLAEFEQRLETMERNRNHDTVKLHGYIAEAKQVKLDHVKLDHLPAVTDKLGERVGELRANDQDLRASVKASALG